MKYEEIKERILYVESRMVAMRLMLSNIFKGTLSYIDGVANELRVIDDYLRENGHIETNDVNIALKRLNVYDKLDDEEKEVTGVRISEIFHSFKYIIREKTPGWEDVVYLEKRKHRKKRAFKKMFDTFAEYNNLSQ